MRHRRLWMIGLLAAELAVAREKKPKVPAPTPLDNFVREAAGRKPDPGTDSSGSLYSSSSRFGDMVRDLRASQVDDIVTILVADRASAVSRASTASQRKSSVKNTIAKLAGPTKAGGALADLAELSGDQSLQGQGSTTRDTTVNTTIAARVVKVLPNGLLVIEGSKLVSVNSESQTVTVRGIARVFDIATGNLVRSDRMAELEVRINGKGVVGDAVRRPMFLYRLLLGLLPF